MPFVDTEDFLAATGQVTFEPGQTRVCENVTIIDDNEMEPMEETFGAFIEDVLPSPLDPVVERDMANVTIVDDDGMYGICAGMSLLHI